MRSEGMVSEFGDDGSGVGSSCSRLPVDDDLTATRVPRQARTPAHECLVSRCQTCTPALFRVRWRLPGTKCWRN